MMDKDAVRGWFGYGDFLTDAEVERYTGGKGYGWFTTTAGQEVYVCDGSHKCGRRGVKVLQLDGLK